MNRRILGAWVETQLAPKLQPGDGVVRLLDSDSARSRSTVSVRELDSKSYDDEVCRAERQTGSHMREQRGA